MVGIIDQEKTETSLFRPRLWRPKRPIPEMWASRCPVL